MAVDLTPRCPKLILNECEEFFTTIDRKLRQRRLTMTRFAKNIAAIKRSVNEVAEYADEYNYSDLRCNGYWTYIRTVHIFLRIVDNEVSTECVVDFYDISRALLSIYKHMSSVREVTKDCVSRENGTKTREKLEKCLFAPTIAHTIAPFRDLISKETDYSVVYGTYGIFWFAPSIKLFCEFYMLILSFFGTRFPMNLQCLFNKRYRGRRFFKSVQKPTKHYPFWIWNCVDLWLYKKTVLNLLTYDCHTTSKTISIPCQKQWIISKQGCIKQCVSEDSVVTKKSSVRCRFIKSKIDKNTTESLLFHCHGGGFMAHSPDCHEDYLRVWVSRLPGIPALSVDYSLRAEFPVAIQDVLDAYLWVTSGSEDVKNTLGFNPRNIVVCGDSAGANLVMGLNYILHDIYERNPFNARMCLPTSVVLFYPALNLTPQISPSRIVCASDPIIAPGLLLYVDSVYSGLDQELNQSELSSGYPFPISVIVKAMKFFVTAPKRIWNFVCGNNNKLWFECNDLVMMQRLQRMSDLLSSPYASTLFYTNFERLKDCSLFIVTSSFCPLLDDSITLAKLWKGFTTLDVLDKLPHGFLHFRLFSKEAKSAFDLCVNRLLQAFKLG